jgi:hypothetical protein
MASNSRLGVQIDVDNAPIDALQKSIHTLLQSVADMSSKLGGSVAASVETSVKHTQAASNAVVAADKKIVESARSANNEKAIISEAAANRIAKSAEAAAKLEEKYSKVATAELINDIKHLQDEKAKAVNAAKMATLEGAKEEAKAIKVTVEAYDQELRTLKQLALERKEVQKEGAGAKTGLLGTGRQNADGDKKGGGAMAAFAGGAGVMLAVQGLQALRVHAKEADDAMDGLTTGLKMTGSQGPKLKADLDIASKGATQMSKDFAMTKEEVMLLQGRIASLSGKTGEELNKMTELSIGAAQSMQLAPEQVAKMLTGATDPEIEKGLTKMGIAFDKNATAGDRMRIIQERLGPAIAAAKEAANDGTGAFDRLMNTVMSSVADVANDLMTALQPALDALLPLFTQLAELLKPIIEQLGGFLAPIIAKLSALITEFAPIIGDLLSAAFGLVEPILSVVMDLFKEIVPVIADVVKVIVSSLVPVFNGLKPVIETVASIVKEVLMAVIGGGLIPILQDVLVPIIRDLLAPVLLSLMPLLKMVADIAAAILIPAVQLLSSILKFLVDNAIQPLVHWLTGALQGAIKAVVGVITEAVGAVTKIAGAIGDFLGLGGKAAETIKKAGPAVVQAQAEVGADVQAERERQDKAALAAQKKAEAEQAKSQKAAHSAAAKETKSAYDTAKSLLDNALADEKARLEIAVADGHQTDAEAKIAELKAQQDHDTKLLALSEKYHKASAQMKATLAKDNAAIRKAEHDAILAQNASDLQDELDQVQDKYAKGLISEQDSNAQEAKLKKEALLAQIAIETEWGNDVTALRKQLDSTERAEMAAQTKEILAEAKRRKSLQKEIAKMSGSSSEEDNENDRYQQALEDRADDLKDAKMGLLLREAMESDHQNKLAAIRDRAYQTELNKTKSLFGGLTAIAISNNTERLKAAEQFASHELGIQNLSLVTQQGGLKKFLTQNLAQLATNKAAELAIWLSSEYQKTAATHSGVLARVGAVAVEIGQNIMAAASSAFTAVAEGIASVMAMPFPLNLALAVGIPGAVFGLYEGAKSLFKFADGALLTQPTNFMFGGNAGQAGEAGHEAIIPLNQYPGMKTLMDGGMEAHTQQIVGALKEVHSAVNSIPRTTIIDQNKNILSQNQFLASERRRSI